MEEGLKIDSNDPFTPGNGIRRRALLPWWIKVFVWIFMLFGILVPPVIVMGIMGYHFELALYGIETTDPHSLAGLAVTLIFMIKGAVAFGLWTEQDWAVDLGIVDASIGIVVCSLFMLVFPFLNSTNGLHINIRLEILILIPYLIKMIKIKQDWKNTIAD